MVVAETNTRTEVVAVAQDKTLQKPEDWACLKATVGKLIPEVSDTSTTAVEATSFLIKLVDKTCP